MHITKNTSPVGTMPVMVLYKLYKSEATMPAMVLHMQVAAMTVMTLYKVALPVMGLLWASRLTRIVEQMKAN